MCLLNLHLKDITSHIDSLSFFHVFHISQCQDEFASRCINMFLAVFQMVDLFLRISPVPDTINITTVF